MNTESQKDTTIVSDDSFDIMEYVSILRRRWLVMMLAVITITILGTAYTVQLPKIYQANTVIVLNNETVRPLGRQVESLESSASYYLFNKDYRNTQAKVITSRPVLQKVVDSLKLGSNYKFLGIDKLLPEQQAQALKHHNAVDILAGQVAVTLGRDSDLATITVKNRDPELARMIAAEMVNSYNALRRESKLSMTGTATTWLDEQEEELLKQLNSAEATLMEFQRDNNIAATSFEEYEKLIADKQQRLNTQLMAVKSELWKVNAQLQTLSGYQNDYQAMLSSPLTMGNATLERIREQVQAKQLAFNATASQYGPKHPTYLVAKQELQAVTDELNNEIKLVVNRTRQQKNELDRTLRSINQELSETRQEALRLNGLSVEYQRRNYELTNYRNLYALVIKRSKETQLGGVAQFVDVEVVEQPTTPRSPVYPRTNINILLSLILGFFAAIVLAFILETLDTKLEGREETERLVRKPFLGALTRIEHSDHPEHDKNVKISPEDLARYQALNDRRRIEYFPQFFPKSSLAESVRFIRTNLIASGLDETPTSILLTSANPKEGKSTVTNFIASSLAALGKKVIIIDTDLHKPMVHHIYDLKNNIGISSVLTGRKTLDQAIQQSDIPGLSVLTSGPLPPNSAELLCSSEFHTLIQDLKERYDYVIFDSPPLLALSDALIISRMVDHLLLVIQPGLTDRNSLKNIVGQVHQIKAPLMGFILNGVNHKTAHYGHNGYYYHYGKNYSSYSNSYGEDEK